MKTSSTGSRILLAGRCEERISSLSFRWLPPSIEIGIQKLPLAGAEMMEQCRPHDIQRSGDFFGRASPR
jgi:hypothetical protein